MSRFAEPVFIAAGLRTPFGRGGGALAAYDAVSLSVPVVQAMAAKAEKQTGQLPEEVELSWETAASSQVREMVPVVLIMNSAVMYS